MKNRKFSNGMGLVAAVLVLALISSVATWSQQAVFNLGTNPASIAGTISSNIAQINGNTALAGNGVTGTGSLRVTIASNNTAIDVNAIESGTWTVQPGNTPNTSPWLAAPATQATTTNSALTSYLAAAASTNSTSVKGSAGNVYQITGLNTTSTLYYLRMYNTASAPTCSSATGYIETLALPNAAGAGAGFSITNAVPQGYTTGIGYCITGGPDPTDATNAATGVFVRILYK